jgi:hypothetical protein
MLHLQSKLYIQPDPLREELLIRHGQGGIIPDFAFTNGINTNGTLPEERRGKRNGRSQPHRKSNTSSLKEVADIYSNRYCRSSDDCFEQKWSKCDDMKTKKGSDRKFVSKIA